MKPTILAVVALSLSMPPSGAHEEIDYEITSAHEGLREAAKYAISKGDKTLFDTLLKAGLQINKPLDADYKESALHEAVSRENPDMIRYLLKQGANPLLRDNGGNRPIDNLERARVTDITPFITALTREPTAYDKKQLMQIPVAVWHEILGAPEPAPDPLAPPVEDPDAIPLVPFVSINGKDPAPEMTPALNAHFPGWRSRSRAQETIENKVTHIYWDTQTHERGEIVEITLVASSSKEVSARGSGTITSHVRKQALPAYEFKIRRATGPFLSGGGWGGHVVLIAGYWVKVGTAGWDE